jgi:hypothetical protein
MPAGYSWHPIEDFEADPKSLTDGEMRSLWRKTATVSNLSISFQSLGPRYWGSIGVVAYLSSHGSEPVLFPGGTFQISYEEPLNDAQQRFAAWLERMIVAGLTE